MAPAAITRSRHTESLGAIERIVRGLGASGEPCSGDRRGPEGTGEPDSEREQLGSPRPPGHDHPVRRVQPLERPLLAGMGRLPDR